MLEVTHATNERMKAALLLLEHKAKRLKEEHDNIHCFLDWDDVEEVLCVAGFGEEPFNITEEQPIARII